MKKPMKAALFSALVFPGSGHLLLKKYFYGLLLTVAAIASLYMVMSVPLERAYQIVDKIERGELQPDVATISRMVSVPPTDAEARLISIGSTLLIIVWLIGIIDSYRVGKKLEKPDI